MLGYNVASQFAANENGTRNISHRGQKITLEKTFTGDVQSSIAHQYLNCKINDILVDFESKHNQ